MIVFNLLSEVVMSFADEFNFQRNMIVEEVVKDEESVNWLEFVEFVGEFGIVDEENDELSHEPDAVVQIALKCAAIFCYNPLKFLNLL